VLAKRIRIRSVRWKVLDNPAAPRFAERSKRLATEVRSSGAQTVKEKYKTSRKKVVSNFIKQRIRTNQFRESSAALWIAIMPP
jgi:hypothetical protein